ncbi:hypothetical protein JOF48_002838 [Arthrobacter stackebrandtii]|uniref:Uncharacterized protein n=1 Tax=Arthrobacter stackebrandtii TaxID=272161 RepID=A0ABS4YZ17_9MICC|nr:hypothetical protein [Arthrobacter stackebrandtii]MBP2414039.1 hypothetical protein [Arthrobacter stackebrandtii]
MAALWSLLLAGPVLAVNAGHSGPSGIPASSHAAVQASSARASIPQQAAPTPGKATYESTRTATPKTAPEGSPFYVQLIMIVLLVVLGVGYFKLMGHSGRPTPSTQAEKAEKAAQADPAKAPAAEKQPSDA